MLNELYKLATTLEENQIKPQVWHDEYGVLPSGACYRIWLCNDGTVNKVELINKKLVDVCRKYGNLQGTFPAFNIAPLYRLTSKEGKTYYDALLNGKGRVDVDRLRSMCIIDNWSIKSLKHVDSCLHKTIPSVSDCSVISALMHICKNIDAHALRDTLETCVWEHISYDTKAYLPMLFHQGSTDYPLSIMLDLADWERFINPVANENTTRQINEYLMDTLDLGEPPKTGIYDAFGAPHNGFKKTMPSVRLMPGFDVVLRSMFREHQCQYRYGKAGDGSFPITIPNRYATKTALEWITRTDNEDKMWRKIDNDAMLFVYPDKLPEIPPKFAGLFGGNAGDRQSDTTKESRFETIAQDFIITFNAIEPKNKPENIQIFALQKVDKKSMRAKVVFTRNLTVNGLVNDAGKWQKGCLNIPSVYMVEPSIPFPLDVSRIANKVWKQNGTRADGKSAAKLMQYYQGMELLLDAPIQSQLLRIVRGITANWSGFVLFAGNNMGIPRKKNPLKDFHKAEIASMLPLLGLILYKCDVLKEDYMQDTAYLLGQILKVSDSLHALYCEIKRDGDIPPQLAGNGVFVTASETPAKALALLCTRMMPYISWAKQYSAPKNKEKEKSGLAGWHLRQYEILMTQLNPKLTEDIRFKELEKAQLFIGYLAELPKSGNEKSSEQEDM